MKVTLFDLRRTLARAVRRARCLPRLRASLWVVLFLGIEREIAVYSSSTRVNGVVKFVLVLTTLLLYVGFAAGGDDKKSSSSTPTRQSSPAPAPHPSGPPPARQSSPPPASRPSSPPQNSGGASHQANSGGGYHASTGGSATAPTTSNVPRGPSANAPSHGTATGGSHGTTMQGGSTSNASRTPLANGSAHGGAVSGTSQGASNNGVHHTSPEAGRSNPASPSAGGKNSTALAGNPGHSSPSSSPVGHGPPNRTPAFNGTPSPAGSRVVPVGNGSTIRVRPNGKPSDVHDVSHNMDIHHGLNGDRRISVERADHSRMVTQRGQRGYIERGYHFHDHDYARRSYYYHGRYSTYYYRPYYYHGYSMVAYAPAVYYAPGFYGWAYNPWAAPAVYSWGWAGAPWYGYYGPYFTPYPVYPSAAFWLTDYIVSASLAQAYQAQVDEQVAPEALSSGQGYLTPEVKDMIANEVKQQIALENAEALQNAQKQDIDPQSSGIARLLSDNQTHVFIAGSDLDVVQTSGQECAISQGDVLEVTSAPAPDATAATAAVLCSKGGGECPKSALVSVGFSDLQEMQNHMRESIDQGLSDLQSKQGQGGLPPAPPSARAAGIQSAFLADAPPPEQNIAAQFQQQSQLADQSEREIARDVPPSVTEGAPGSSGGSSPVNIALGQTPGQVTAALGQPKSIVDLGTKKIYVYPEMKVTFKGGKVSDVE